MSDLISVIITTKNRKFLLERALYSVLNQTYQNIEIIIVDDGSTDGTEEYIKKIFLKNKKIKFLRNENSRGACYSRNKGISFAKGLFISGLDDDDTYSPRRLEILMNNYSDKFSFICSHALNIYDDYVEKEKEKMRIIDYSDILKTNFVGSQVLVKRERMIKVGLFDETFQASQDHDMWCRLIKKYGPALKLQENLYNCYVDSSITRVSEKKVLGLKQFYEKHKDDMTVYIKLFNFLRLIKMYFNKYNLIGR